MMNNKVGYFFILMASIVIVLAGIKSSAEILIPFLLSLFIAIILSPSYNFLKKRGISDILSLTLIIALFILCIAFIVKLIGTSLNDFSANIDIYSDKLSIEYLMLVGYLNNIGISLPTYELSNLLNSKQIFLFSTTILQSMGLMFTNGFVVIFTVIFMLLESKHFIEKIDYIDGDRDTIVHIAEIFTKIKSYMVLKTLVSLLTGFLIWIALLFIGTDYAFLWAVLAFLFNFIPNIGSIIAAVPAVLISLVQLGSFSAFLVVLLYVVVNVVVSSVIEPKVMGRGLGLSSLVVFLSLLFWGWLLGIVGMLLSIPLTIMAKIAFDTDEKTKWIAVLLGTGEHIKKK